MERPRAKHASKVKDSTETTENQPSNRGCRLDNDYEIALAIATTAAAVAAGAIDIANERIDISRQKGSMFYRREYVGTINLTCYPALCGGERARGRPSGTAGGCLFASRQDSPPPTGEDTPPPIPPGVRKAPLIWAE